jgi:hypothetical protein
MSKTLRESWHPRSPVADDALGDGYSGNTFVTGRSQRQPEQSEELKPPAQGDDMVAAYSSACAAAEYPPTIKVEQPLAQAPSGAPAADQITSMDAAVPVPADVSAAAFSVGQLMATVEQAAST